MWWWDIARLSEWLAEFSNCIFDYELKNAMNKITRRDH